MKTGQQMQSRVCSGKVIVLRAPKDESVILSCGGVPMVDAGAAEARDKQNADPALLGGSVMGKRYVDAEAGVQLLCVTAGEGTLTVNGRPLEIEAAKQLPSSD
jgi:hypothetical protein